ncbi:MAG: SDR family NAD(P)-dependent oxidoreductase, partial [Gemmatimonadaceae bacterium]|nr:SDR family NAD(P)-dependent oxidoreductase [Acetobacteraceae bacterium]
RILVNCAGVVTGARIVGRDGPASLDAFARVVQVNLIGTFNMMRLVAAGASTLPPLEDGERGVIVSTASIAAYEGQIGQAAYAASKAGVIGLTLPAARELAPLGIRVCTIAPGIFGTPMLQGLPQDMQDKLGAGVPFPSRLGRPEEFAKLVLAILGNAMLNGETIRLDGAFRMPPK